jgi:hypothetical protein
MTVGGWLLMASSVGFVLGLTIYCFYRVMTLPKTEGHLHAPLDIETDERDD